MLLVTTALEKTWGKNEEILFLGDWCKLYKRKNAWKERISYTLMDPWSDRGSRFNAYQYTQDLYQETINELADYLNRIHGVSYPVRYWKILCGPWLRLFINSLYHKWECIDVVVKRGDSVKTICLNINDEQIVPNDMKEFEALMVSDEWNHYHFSKIIDEFGLPHEVLSFDTPELMEIKIQSYIKTNKLKKFIEVLYNFSMKVVNRPTSIFISKPYLSKFSTLLLAIKLRSMPRLSLNSGGIKKYRHHGVMRNQAVVENLDCTGFKKFLNRIIVSHIPRNYLEGYATLQQAVGSQGWPERPPTILTAVDHFSDDIFKCYAANKIISGSKLKIICHGGGGKMKYSDFQMHDLDICDDYFTWGWSEYWIDKCTKGFFVKNFFKKRVKNTGQHLLLHIMLSEYRYSKFISASPSYEQFVNTYLDNQIKFLNNILSKIKQDTITKLHFDYENSIEERINENCVGVHYAQMGEDYYKLLQNSKLVVATYNCTTFVESIAFNIPTIIFWDLDHWELTVSAIPFFDKLQECGVFHTSAESAALMVNQVWDDVDKWWQSEEVKHACGEFRSWFCRKSHAPIKELAFFCSQDENKSSKGNA